MRMRLRQIGIVAYWILAFFFGAALLGEMYRSEAPLWVCQAWSRSMGRFGIGDAIGVACEYAVVYSLPFVTTVSVLKYSRWGADFYPRWFMGLWATATAFIFLRPSIEFLHNVPDTSGGVFIVWAVVTFMLVVSLLVESGERRAKEKYARENTEHGLVQAEEAFMVLAKYTRAEPHVIRAAWSKASASSEDSERHGNTVAWLEDNAYAPFEEYL